MNQENYKAIAEIIKRARGISMYERVGKCGSTIDANHLIFKLADYFEKDDKSYKPMFRNDFNKKQFLKEAGVDKE